MVIYDANFDLNHLPALERAEDRPFGVWGAVGVGGGKALPDQARDVQAERDVKTKTKTRDCFDSARDTTTTKLFQANVIAVGDENDLPCDVGPRLDGSLYVVYLVLESTSQLSFNAPPRQNDPRGQAKNVRTRRGSPHTPFRTAIASGST